MAADQVVLNTGTLAEGEWIKDVGVFLFGTYLRRVSKAGRSQTVTFAVVKVSSRFYQSCKNLD